MFSSLSLAKELPSLVIHLLRQLLLEITSGSSLGFFASSSSVDIVVSATCLVACRLTYGLTQVDQNNLRPRSICTTTVSPDMWMNLKGPSYIFAFAWKTRAELLGGKLRSYDECSMPFGFLSAANQMKFPSETAPLQLPPWAYQSILPLLVERVPDWSVPVQEWLQNLKEWDKGLPVPRYSWLRILQVVGTPCSRCGGRYRRECSHLEDGNGHDIFWRQQLRLVFRLMLLRSELRRARLSNSFFPTYMPSRDQL